MECTPTNRDENHNNNTNHNNNNKDNHSIILNSHDHGTKRPHRDEDHHNQQDNHTNNNSNSNSIITSSNHPMIIARPKSLASHLFSKSWSHFGGMVHPEDHNDGNEENPHHHSITDINWHDDNWLESEITPTMTTTMMQKETTTTTTTFDCNHRRPGLAVRCQSVGVVDIRTSSSSRSSSNHHNPRRSNSIHSIKNRFQKNPSRRGSKSISMPDQIIEQGFAKENVDHNTSVMIDSRTKEVIIDRELQEDRDDDVIDDEEADDDDDHRHPHKVMYLNKVIPTNKSMTRHPLSPLSKTTKSVSKQETPASQLSSSPPPLDHRARVVGNDEEEAIGIKQDSRDDQAMILDESINHSMTLVTSSKAAYTMTTENPFLLSTNEANDEKVEHAINDDDKDIAGGGNSDDRHNHMMMLDGNDRLCMDYDDISTISYDSIRRQNPYWTPEADAMHPPPPMMIAYKNRPSSIDSNVSSGKDTPHLLAASTLHLSVMSSRSISDGGIIAGRRMSSSSTLLFMQQQQQLQQQQQQQQQHHHHHQQQQVKEHIEPIQDWQVGWLNNANNDSTMNHNQTPLQEVFSKFDPFYQHHRTDDDHQGRRDQKPIMNNSSNTKDDKHMSLMTEWKHEEEDGVKKKKNKKWLDLSSTKKKKEKVRSSTPPVASTTPSTTAGTMPHDVDVSLTFEEVFSLHSGEVKEQEKDHVNKSKVKKIMPSSFGFTRSSHRNHHLPPDPNRVHVTPPMMTTTFKSASDHRRTQSATNPIVSLPVLTKRTNMTNGGAVMISNSSSNHHNIDHSHNFPVEQSPTSSSTSLKKSSPFGNFIASKKTSDFNANIEHYLNHGRSIEPGLHPWNSPHTGAAAGTGEPTTPTTTSSTSKSAFDGSYHRRRVVMMTTDGDPVSCSSNEEERNTGPNRVLVYDHEEDGNDDDDDNDDNELFVSPHQYHRVHYHGMKKSRKFMTRSERLKQQRPPQQPAPLIGKHPSVGGAVVVPATANSKPPLTSSSSSSVMIPASFPYNHGDDNNHDHHHPDSSSHRSWWDRKMQSLASPRRANLYKINGGKKIDTDKLGVTCLI